MVKQCLYCGQPLPKDDARFCNDCGRAQFPPSAAAKGSSSIKVKLPPREFSRNLPHAAQETEIAPETPSGVVRRFAREQSAQQPPLVPRRPVRMTVETSPVQGEKVEENASLHVASLPDSPFSLPSEVAPGYGPAADVPPPVVSQNVSEESSMVLPGWQEELARLRKEHAATSVPTPSEKSVTAFPPESDVAPQRSPRAPSTAEDLSNVSKREQENSASEEHQADPPQRELQVKIWEQETTIHLSQSPVEKNIPGPAPAVEQTPFSALPFGPDEQAEEIADLDTVTWQTVKEPEVSEPRAKEESTPAFERSEENAVEDDVEDLPTVVLPVPEPVKDQPHFKVERTSTPDPRSRVSEQTEEEEVDDLPTVPLPAHSSMPRSPLPPVSQQAYPRQEHVPDQQGPMNSSRVSNPASQPGVYRQTPAVQSAHPTQGPGTFAPAEQPIQPRTQAGPTFHPSTLPPLPHNPASQPGNPPSWPNVRDSGQPSGGRAVDASVPNTPPPTSADVSSALVKARKRRTRRVLAALLPALVIVGVITFIVYYQPFTNALPHTDQSYQSASLGFSLRYPLGWKATLNQASSTVHFADSSQTGQVNLSTSAANGSTLSQYLSQQATQLGITNQKAAPAVTFAGTTWQQVQGTISQSGATYTITLYVTSHNNRFYTLACLAPPPVYAGMEHDDFAPLRASFQFM